MSEMRLADGLGAVGALTALAHYPGVATDAKLLVLVAGALALAPAVFLRWRSRVGLSLPVLVVGGAAAGIVAWGLISTLGSGAPWAPSIFGWWGRANGLLAWLGAAILLLGAATLDRQGIARVVTWLLGGATLVALVGVAQVGGVDVPPGPRGGGVEGMMGNSNFAAGYFAIVAILALGRALTQAPLWQRIWAGALFVVLAALSFLTQSLQGPASLAAGLVAVGIAWALLNRGRWRVAGLIGAGGLVIVSAGLVLASFFAVGPLAVLWSEVNFDIRQQIWVAAWNTMNGLPAFGAGPDGFSRYIAEYRSEGYVELLGPTSFADAAHNVALQFGAVLGWPGLILWLILFAGSLVLLLVRLTRAPVASIALTASVMGALVTYVVQGMVSIDTPPLLATGWIACGLALAAAQEPVPALSPEPAPAPAKRNAKARDVSRVPVASARVKSPTWVPVTGGLLAVGGVIIVGFQMSETVGIQSITSRADTVSYLTNPLTPCPLRAQVAQNIYLEWAPQDSAPAIYEATGLDPRCESMTNYQSYVALRQNDLGGAGAATQEGIAINPLFDWAWSLRSTYLLASGDVAGAQAALDEGARVQALYPATSEKSPLADIQAQIDAANN